MGPTLVRGSAEAEDVIAEGRGGAGDEGGKIHRVLLDEADHTPF
jgi:hypothetical protein